ncbi:MAG: hypothetical protein U0836_23260 [Pirellulales bacterium]
MHDEPRDSEFSPFEQALAGLTPAAKLARDELLFAAGRAAAERNAALAQHGGRRRAWPLATAALALLSLGLNAALLARAPRTEIVYVERPATPVADARAVAIAPAVTLPTNREAFSPSRFSTQFPPESYASLREQALRGEFERRPVSEPSAASGEAATPSSEPTYRALRDALLEAAG